MNEKTDIRPFMPNPDKLYVREVKAQLMKVVLVVALYFVVQFLLDGIIGAAIMFSSGDFMDSIMRGVRGVAEGGSMSDYNDIVESSMGSAQGLLSEHMGLLSIISAACAMPVFLILRGKRLFTSDIAHSHAPLSRQSFMELWIIAMGAQLIFSAGTYFINSALERSGHSVTELLEQSMRMLQTPSGLVYICIAGPIIEEIIFRGAIMKSLERFGLNFSIVMSSLIFGLFHVFTVQAVFAFFMGLILGYIASRYSIRWSILAHILINSVASALDIFGDTDKVFGISNMILLFFLACGIFFFIKERWRITEQKSIGAPIRIPGSPERVGRALWGAAFTSIPMILYIAVTVFAGLAMIFMPSVNLGF